MDYTISNHAKIEIERREIPMEYVHQVMEKPGQVVESYGQRKIYQSRFFIDSRDWLVRVVVEEWRSPPLVVTAYRTSKIAKYWSEK